MYSELSVSDRCNGTTPYTSDICVIKGGLNEEEAFRLYLNDLNFSTPSLHLCIERYKKNILSFTDTQDVLIVSAINLLIIIIVGIIICLLYKYANCKYGGTTTLHGKQSYKLKTINRYDNDKRHQYTKDGSANDTLNVAESCNVRNETNV